MPPRKRKAAAPAGVDEVDAAAEEVAPAAAVDDELPRHPSEGGTTAGPGDAPAPAPVVETEEAAAGGDAPCVGELRGEEASVPEVDALEGEDAQAHAQAGGEDGRGVTAGDAPHAAPVASSAPQEWELAPQVPAECTLSPAFRLSQLPDGTNVEEIQAALSPHGVMGAVTLETYDGRFAAVVRLAPHEGKGVEQLCEALAKAFPNDAATAALRRQGGIPPPLASVPLHGASGAAAVVTLCPLDVLGVLGCGNNMNPLVFVPGVPPSVNSDALRTAFAATGAAVQAAWVMHSPLDGKHKRYGFVEFVLPSGAAAVMKAKAVGCGGAMLRPEPAFTRQYHHMFARTLFVDGFPRETTTVEQLKAWAEEGCSGGTVSDVSLPLLAQNHANRGTPRGYAFLEFARSDEAHVAREALDGKEVGAPGADGKQHTLRVSFSNPTKHMIPARPANPRPAGGGAPGGAAAAAPQKQQQQGQKGGGGKGGGDAAKRPGGVAQPLGSRGMQQQHMQQQQQQWRGPPGGPHMMRGGPPPPHMMGGPPGYGRPPMMGPPMTGQFGMPYPGAPMGMPYGGMGHQGMMPPPAMAAAMYAQQHQQQQAAAAAAAAAAQQQMRIVQQQQQAMMAQQQQQYMTAAYAQQQQQHQQAPVAAAHDPWAAYHSAPEGGMQAQHPGGPAPTPYYPGAAPAGPDPGAAAAWAAYYAPQGAPGGGLSHPAAAAAAQQSYYTYTDPSKRQKM